MESGANYSATDLTGNLGARLKFGDGDTEAGTRNVHVDLKRGSPRLSNALQQQQ